MPGLWYSGQRMETYIYLGTQAKSYFKSRGERMVSLVPGMGHGHGAAWIRDESYAFAQSVVNQGHGPRA